MSADAPQPDGRAVNAHDLDGYIDGYADDVVLHGGPRAWRGKEGARALTGSSSPRSHIDLRLYETLFGG